MNNYKKLKLNIAQTIKRNNFIVSLIVCTVAIIVFIMFLLVYSFLTDRIIHSSIQNMEEMVQHDERSIVSSLEYRWSTIEGIANEIKQMDLDNMNDVVKLLNLKIQTSKARKAVLVTSDGTMYGSDSSVTHDNTMYDVCKKEDGEFVYRGDLLVIGAKVEPFSVDNHTFEYILCYYDVDTLTNELKITSYDGKGYSSVVDFDGNYIVSISRETGLFRRENFYDILQSADIENGVTVKDVQQHIANKDSFSITYTRNDERFIMTLNPMEDMDWYMLTSIPRSVFEQRSASLFRILAFLTFFVLLAAVIVLSLIVRNRSQHKLMKLEIDHHAELQSALDLAEQASKAKTTFLNNMSHDIRTPMNAIVGFTNLAVAHIDEKERVKEYLEKIAQSSNHLLSLINDVLDMSRIEAGKVVIEEGEENLAEILHNVRDIVQADIQAKGLEFFVDTVDIVDEDIYCDKLRLNQVLLNLLSNSIKFTPAGGKVMLRIKQKPSSKKGYASYEFIIKDTGIGMEQEFIKDIFEPFARERNSTVSGIQGTGLGMSIAKNIIDMMGGSIKVKSKVGEGTEFNVSLSFKLQDKEKEALAIKNLQGVRALVVDDDINSCESISNMLNQLGMKAEWTNVPKEAIDKVKNSISSNDEFQLYFIDWLMPDMDGIELTRTIKKIAAKGTHIIIVSAYDWGNIEKEATAAGVTGHISKPLFPSDLKSLLTQIYGEVQKKQETVAQDNNFKGKRILLVEDNIMNREIATEYLQDFGFLVESAINGKEACKVLKESKPGYFDLVLMDIQMPIMNGYEATREIRKFENKDIANIPILAMTANAFEEDKKAAIEAGMNGHLAKPIDIPELIKALKEILQ